MKRIDDETFIPSVKKAEKIAVIASVDSIAACLGEAPCSSVIDGMQELLNPLRPWQTQDRKFAVSISLSC
jgi:hypothetical protein